MSDERPAKKVPQHLASWAAQDWLTSRARMRSIATGDPWLRIVYFEALNALREAGGELTSDPEALADKLGAPAAEVARCLPILDRIARTPGCRGGLIVDGDTVRNLRTSQEVERDVAFRARQAEFGREGGAIAGKGRPKGSAKARQGQPMATPINDGGARSDRGAKGSKRATPNPPLPLSVAVSGSVAVPVSVAVGEQRGVAGEGAGGAQPSPPAPADISGEPTTATANGAEPDLRSAIDHDPGNEIDVAIVAFCVRMAKVEAWREDRQPRAADALRILEAVSATPAGVTLSGLRNASAAWKEQTWRACELFEQDARGEGEQPP